jgi:hypothetical protein
LTPVLVQSVATTTESGAGSLVTALQFKIDSLARVSRICDLGRLVDPTDDVCADYTYHDHIQLSFIHGATGGGTLAYDRRDRVQSVAIWTGKTRTHPPVRLRTASYDPTNGDLVALCQFEKTDSQDSCAELASLPLASSEFQAVSLRSANGRRIALRRYRYDAFGNLDWYLSPLGADGFFTSRVVAFDPYVHLVEQEEDTDYCNLSTSGANRGNCPAGSTTELGTFVSRSGDVDWRHARRST